MTSKISSRDIAIKKRLDKFANVKIPDDIENYEKYLLKYKNGFKFRIGNIIAYFNSNVLSRDEIEDNIIKFIQKLLDIREIKKKIIKKRENIARRPGCGKPLTQDANENIKKCSKCNLIKNILEFPKKGHKCKHCINLYKKKYKEKTMHTNKMYYEKNKEQIKQNAKMYYEKNIEKIKERNKYFRKNNTSKIYDANRKYKEKYPERVKAYKKKSSQREESIIVKAVRRRFKNIFKTDNFRFYEYFRIRKIIYTKWIESNFDNNMNWQNYGTYWHLDHIIPCSAFDLSKDEDFLKCFHWSNLRPCEKIENLRKSNKIDTNLIEYYKIKSIEFEQQFAFESDN
jgi:hypothetical protein